MQITRTNTCAACGCESPGLACAVCGAERAFDLNDRKAVNEHYGRLNERFDVRIGVLIRLGFTAVHLKEYGVSLYVRKGFCKDAAIPTAFVMCADEIVWQEKVKDVTPPDYLPPAA